MSGYAPRPSTTIGLYTIRPCVRPPHGPPQMATPLGPAELHDWHRPNHDHVFTRESTQITTEITFVTSASGTTPAKKVCAVTIWPLDVRADANRSKIDRKYPPTVGIWRAGEKKSPSGVVRTIFRAGFHKENVPRGAYHTAISRPPPVRTQITRESRAPGLAPKSRNKSRVIPVKAKPRVAR